MSTHWSKYVVIALAAAVTFTSLICYLMIILDTKFIDLIVDMIKPCILVETTGCLCMMLSHLLTALGVENLCQFIGILYYSGTIMITTAFFTETYHFYVV